MSAREFNRLRVQRASLIDCVSSARVLSFMFLWQKSFFAFAIFITETEYIHDLNFDILFVLML